MGTSTKKISQQSNTLDKNRSGISTIFGQFFKDSLIYAANFDCYKIHIPFVLEFSLCLIFDVLLIQVLKF